MPAALSFFHRHILRLFPIVLLISLLAACGAGPTVNSEGSPRFPAGGGNISAEWIPLAQRLYADGVDPGVVNAYFSHFFWFLLR